MPRDGGGDGTTHRSGRPGTAPDREPEPLLVDAAEFMAALSPRREVTENRMPSGFEAGTLRRSAGGHVGFQHSVLTTLAASTAEVRTAVPAGGTYSLWVRSYPGGGGSFAVEVAGATAETTFPGDGGWVSGGSFDLSAGEVPVRLSVREPGAHLDLVALVPETGDGAVAGPPSDETLDRCAYPDEVRLLRTYTLDEEPVAVKFGDLRGDGQIGLLSVEGDYSAHVYDGAGERLWGYEAPSAGADLRTGFEPPGLVWDVDGDGRGEVIHWRQFDEADHSAEQYLVVADGETGEVLSKAPWPTGPSDASYYNCRLAVGKLTPGEIDDVVVFSDSGGTIQVEAYEYGDAGLTRRWNHSRSLEKDHLGHYVYPRDLDGDGLDEVLVGSLLLDTDGEVLWEDLPSSNSDHADSVRFADLDGDGREDVVQAQGADPAGVRVRDTERGAVRWTRPAGHTQQVAVGDFLDVGTGPHVAANARRYMLDPGSSPRLWAHVYTFDSGGEPVDVWPTHPVNGNPIFTEGDWRNAGESDLFWHRFGIDGDGTGTLHFPVPVYHQFDVTGDGAEEVVTLDSDEVRVYGSARATRDPADARRDPAYMAYEVANHSHYTGG